MHQPKTDEESESGPRRPGWVARHPGFLRLYRIGIGVIGTAVLAGGIVLIPYPGPGWLVVFAGLAILATEFSWARRVLHYARGRYDAWVAWLKRQHLVVRIAVFAVTCLVVAATLWLLNAYAIVGAWLDIHWPWLRSPIFG